MKEKVEKQKSASLCEIYSISDCKDKLFLCFGIIGSISTGGTYPMFVVFFGGLNDSFSGKNEANNNILDTVGPVALKLSILGGIIFFLSWILMTCWTRLGDRISMKYRERYLESILRQDVSWFDVSKPQELSTSIGAECVAIQNGLGAKVGNVIMGLSMFIGGMVVSFLYGWQLGLVLLAIAPLLMVTGFLLAKVLQSTAIKMNQLYATAGGMAEEALNNVRTVTALRGQNIEESTYGEVLSAMRKGTIKSGTIMALTIGFFRMSMWVVFVGGFWFGAKFIRDNYVNIVWDEHYSAGNVLIIIFCFLISFMSLGIVMPSFKNISEGLVAGAKVRQVMNRQPNMDLSGNRTLTQEEFKGRIEIKDLIFRYPTRPEFPVLKDFCGVFEEKKMTAICGESGSGKSTIIQLLERFYDPEMGGIQIDGAPLPSLDLHWLRQNVGFVGQEPVLFNTTIKENILLGKGDATEEEVEEACKRANCYNFISKFPDRFNTIVGQGGSKLSGGQKQRIAIARAILKSPKIMLLDEATSALDRKNERKVQKALEEVSQGVTTICVAHRLSTIINADKIFVLKEGEVQGEGRHEELLERCPYYYQLYESQSALYMEDEEEVEIYIGADEPSIQSEEGEPTTSATSATTATTDTTARTSDEKQPLLVPEADKKRKESKKESESKAKEKATKAGIWSLLYSNIKYYPLMIAGGFSSIIAGLVYPVVGIMITRLLVCMLNPDPQSQSSNIDLNCLYMLLAGIGDGLFTFFLISSFVLLGQRIVITVRKQLYNRMLTMHIGWFDLDENNYPGLCSKLSEDAMIVNGVIENILGTILQSIFAMVFAIVISFIYSWRMAVTVIGLTPLLMLAGFIEQTAMGEMGGMKSEQFPQAASVIAESCTNYRTICSFNGSSKINKLHQQLLQEAARPLARKSVVSGIALGYSQAFGFWFLAFLFYIGGVYIHHYNDSTEDIFMCIYVLLFGSIVGAQAKQYVVDWDRAKDAVFHIFQILDQSSAIHPNQEGLSPETFTPKIEFENVWFKYPTRPEYVLKNFSLLIKEGTQVALVGQSGSGKSTVIQLLLRFYDPTSGQILIDGKDIKEYNLNYLRTQMGVVFQEPVLFDRSIRDNIKYGHPELTDRQMIAAAKVANANDFIENDSFMGYIYIYIYILLVQLREQV